MVLSVKLRAIENNIVDKANSLTCLEVLVPPRQTGQTQLGRTLIVITSQKYPLSH